MLLIHESYWVKITCDQLSHRKDSFTDYVGVRGTVFMKQFNLNLIIKETSFELHHCSHLILH